MKYLGPSQEKLEKAMRLGQFWRTEYEIYTPGEPEGPLGPRNFELWATDYQRAFLLGYLLL